MHSGSGFGSRLGKRFRFRFQNIAFVPSIYVTYLSCYRWLRRSGASDSSKFTTGWTRAPTSSTRAGSSKSPTSFWTTGSYSSREWGPCWRPPWMLGVGVGVVVAAPPLSSSILWSLGKSQSYYLPKLFSWTPFLKDLAVLRIRDILVRFRTLIRGSVTLTNRSRFGSGSCFLRQWPSKTATKIFLLITFWSHIYIIF